MAARTLRPRSTTPSPAPHWLAGPSVPPFLFCQHVLQSLSVHVLRRGGRLAGAKRRRCLARPHSTCQLKQQRRQPQTPSPCLTHPTDTRASTSIVAVAAVDKRLSRGPEREVSGGRRNIYRCGRGPQDQTRRECTVSTVKYWKPRKLLTQVRLSRQNWDAGHQSSGAARGKQLAPKWSGS